MDGDPAKGEVLDPDPPDDDEDLWDEPLEFPSWVPIAIGVTLVVLAALAVWQGARF